MTQPVQMTPEQFAENWARERREKQRKAGVKNWDVLCVTASDIAEAYYQYRSSLGEGELEAALRDRDEQLKYAHSAIGGNPSVYLHDKISKLVEELAELKKGLGEGVEGICGKKFTGYRPGSIFSCVLPSGHCGDCDDAPNRAALTPASASGDGGKEK